MYTLISARHRARRSSIVPGGEALLIDEQGLARRSLVDAMAARRLPLLMASADANMLLLLLVWRAAEVRAAEHWLAKRVQLCALVDATVRRRVLLLRLPLSVIGDGQLDIASRATDNDVVDVLRRVGLLQTAVLDAVMEVHDKT